MDNDTSPLTKVGSTDELGAWQPIATVPRDGTSFRVPPDAGYTHCFLQDGLWWWHSVHSGKDGGYAVGPEPKGWAPLLPPAFNASAKCSPTLTQCPRCNNPQHACDAIAPQGRRRGADEFRGRHGSADAPSDGRR